MLLRVWLTDIANCLPPLGSESTHAPMRGNGTRSYSHVEARQFRFQVFSHKSYALRWDHGPATDGGRGDQPGGGVVIADPSRRSSKAARRPAQHQLDRQNRAAQPQSPQPPNLPHHLPSIDSQSWPEQGWQSSTNGRSALAVACERPEIRGGVRARGCKVYVGFSPKISALDGQFIRNAPTRSAARTRAADRIVGTDETARHGTDWRADDHQGKRGPPGIRLAALCSAFNRSRGNDFLSSSF